MRLPFILNPLYRFCATRAPYSLEPLVRGLYNQINKIVTYGVSDIFTALDIETNSKCNLKCSYCPVAYHSRGDVYMPEWLFEKIVRDLSIFPYAGRISPHFYGEPMLDPRVPELLSFARRLLPRSKIIVHTNGTYLNRSSFRRYVDSGITGFLVTRHTPRWPSPLLELVKAEPEAAKYIVMRDLDGIALYNRAGAVTPPRTKRMKRCFVVSDEIVVTHDGNVVCSNDFFTEEVFGNVRDQHLLKDIWWGERFMALRKRLREGRFDLEMCRRCVGRS